MTASETSHFLSHPSHASHDERMLAQTRQQS